MRTVVQTAVGRPRPRATWHRCAASSEAFALKGLQDAGDVWAGCPTDDAERPGPDAPWKQALQAAKADRIDEMTRGRGPSPQHRNPEPPTQTAPAHEATSK
jgi:hypothetical protein